MRHSPNKKNPVHLAEDCRWRDDDVQKLLTVETRKKNRPPDERAKLHRNRQARYGERKQTEVKHFLESLKAVPPIQSPHIDARRGLTDFPETLSISQQCITSATRYLEGCDTAQARSGSRRPTSATDFRKDEGEWFDVPMYDNTVTSLPLPRVSELRYA